MGEIISSVTTQDYKNTIIIISMQFVLEIWIGCYCWREPVLSRVALISDLDCPICTEKNSTLSPFNATEEINE